MSIVRTDSKAQSDPVTVLRGHRSDVQSVRFHPNLNILYSGDAEGDINVWNLNTQRIIQTQRLHPASAGIIALALSKSTEITDEFALISQGRDGTIRTWQLDSNGCLSSRHPFGELCSGSYSFCRFSLLEDSAERSGASDVSSAQTEPLASLAAPLEEGPAAGKEPSRGMSQGSLIAGFFRDTVQREAIAAPEVTGAHPSRREELGRCLATTKHAHRVVTLLTFAQGWKSITVTLWLGTASSLLCHVCRLIAFPGEDPSTAQVWDFQACKMLTELRQQGGMPSLGMCMSLQLFSRPGLPGCFLAVGYEAGHVAIWDIGMKSAPVAVARLHQEPVLGLFIDSSGAGGVTGAAEDKLVCFSIDWAGRRIVERQRMSIAKPGIDMIAIRPDQRIFATGGWDGRVRVYHFAKCKPLTVLKYHKAAVPALAFRQNDAMLASGSRDGTIALWSVFGGAACSPGITI